MNGRLKTWISVLFCLLLPIPLAWLAFTTLVQLPLGYSTMPRPVLIPMLPIMDRVGTPTYQRECESDRDCDPRLRCSFDLVTLSSRCVDSRCMTDRHCPDGFSCQTRLAENDKDLLNDCILAGHRKEGEACNAANNTLESGCERGLVCRGRCGRRCGPGTPGTCPDGFFCEEHPTGSTCQPTCEGLTCPEGQRCVALWGKTSICAKVYGQDCDSVPCDPGTKCTKSQSSQSANEIWMGCVQRCDLPGADPCPEGNVCFVHGCARICSPDDAAACGEGYKCEVRLGLPAICRINRQDREAH